MEIDVVDFLLIVVKEKIGENDGLEFFFLDWSLKIKVRFFFFKMFNWCGILKIFDEGIGMLYFVCC